MYGTGVRGVAHANPWSNVNVPRFLGQEYHGSLSQHKKDMVCITKDRKAVGSMEISMLESYGPC